MRDSVRASFFGGAPAGAGAGEERLLVGRCVALEGHWPTVKHGFCDRLGAELSEEAEAGTLEELDLHHCIVGDVGLQCIARKVQERRERWQRQLASESAKEEQHQQQQVQEANDGEEDDNSSAAASTDDDAQPQRRVLFPALRKLNLSANNLTDHSVPALAELLACMPELRCLRMAGNHFSDAAVTQLSSRLADCLPRLETLYLGATHLSNTAFQTLSRELYRRRSESASHRRQALQNELERAQSENRKWKTEQAQERKAVEDHQAAQRKEICASAETALRNAIKYRNKDAQLLKSRQQLAEADYKQQMRDERRYLEDDEAGGRQSLEREEDAALRHALLDVARRRERVQLRLEYKRKRAQLGELCCEFRDRRMRTEEKQREDIRQRFVKGMGQTMTRERRTIENSERDCREKVAKEQDDQRKALQRAARAGKAGALKSCKFGEDKANTRRETGLAEQNRRNEIIAAEHMARKTLKVVEDEDRNKAREATYAADNGSGGQNRVLCRREAHVRLEIEDQQEAEREQCQIGYLMDVPGTHSAEHVRAMDKLKQQQAEEFAARARKRSLLQMEDLSVLNFENSEGPAHPAHSIQAGESLPATPPDTGEEEEQPVFTPESHASTP